VTDLHVVFSNHLHVNAFSDRPPKIAHFSPMFARELCQIALSPLERGFDAIWHRLLGVESEK
jgi:hypothetical protein